MSFQIIDSKKLDIVIVAFLIAFTFTVAVIFFNNFGEIMIYYDAYFNFDNAITLANGDRLETRGPYPLETPYVIYLSVLYQIFEESPDSMFYLRMINLLSTIQFVVFFYLIARKFFNPFYSIIASFMAIFMPVFLSHTGTLENNIFALSMGITSLYFSIKPKRTTDVIFATLAIAFAASRVDTLLIFIIPYFIGLAHFIGTKTGIRKIFLIIAFLLVFFVPSFFIIQELGGIYKDDYFEHNIFNQIFAFINSETIFMILQSSVEVTGDSAADIVGNDSLNNVYLAIVLIGIGYFLVKYRRNIFEFFSYKKTKLSDASILVIYLSIIIPVSIFSLTSFHLDFVIEGDKIVISDEVLPRYMIDLRLLMLFPFIFGLSLVSVLFEGISQKITKESKSQIQANNFQQVFSVKSSKISIYFSYAFVVFLVIFFSYYMWDSAGRFYENHATMIRVYHDATKWVSENLPEEKMAVLPQKQLFFAIDPSLKERSYDYKSLWEASEIFVRAETTEEEIAHIREELRSFIINKENNVKFLILDWNDPRGTLATGITHLELNKEGQCEKIDDKIKEIKRFHFTLPHSDWRNTMIVCEIA